MRTLTAALLRTGAGHEVKQHWREYAAFGMVAHLMLLVPFIGPFTFVTSVCGAASPHTTGLTKTCRQCSGLSADMRAGAGCWAAELEKRGCRPVGTTAALPPAGGGQPQQQWPQQPVVAARP